MEPVLLLLLAATGLLLVWLLAEALFYNALVELENAREWLGELRAGIRHGAYARASDRKKRTMAYMYERQAAATRRKFQDWLDRELGTPERANAIDRDVLEAQQQTPV